MSDISRREWAAMICAEVTVEMQRLAALADQLGVISAKAHAAFADESNHAAAALCVSIAQAADAQSKALDKLSDQLARVVTVYLAKSPRGGRK